MGQPEPEADKSGEAVAAVAAADVTVEHNVGAALDVELEDAEAPAAASGRDIANVTVEQDQQQ